MSTTSASLVERFVAAIAAQDQSALRDCFAPDAQFRALIPSGLKERNGASDAAALIARWFGDSTALELVDRRSVIVGDRVVLSYRFDGVEEGQPYAVEQTLSCVMSGDKIQSADLLCSGFRPR